MRANLVSVLVAMTALTLATTGCESTTTDCTTGGAIGERYTETGGPAGPLGSCTGAEHDLDGGRSQAFEHGAMYWTPSSGAWEVYGAIGEKYDADGGPSSAVGWPISGELPTPNGLGQFNRFEHGNIYHSPAGTHSVHGAIFDEWGRQGFETGRFGFPTTDEVTTPDGAQTTFEHGTIAWITATGQIVMS